MLRETIHYSLFIIKLNITVNQSVLILSNTLAHTNRQASKNLIVVGKCSYVAEKLASL